MMRILVTGAAGFIGSQLAKRLAALGHDVVAADAFLSSNFSNLVDFPGDVLTLKDAEDTASLAALGPFGVIFHEASLTGVVGTDGADLSGPAGQHRMMRNNVETFRRLLDHAVETRARVIYASSCSIYGRTPAPQSESARPDPLNIYAFSKLCMERLAGRYAEKLAYPIVGLRYSNVYGPGEAHKGKLASMIHQLASQMRQGKRPRIFTPGDQRRDFVYIDDVVQANLNAMNAKAGGAYNVGAGASWTFNQVVEELNHVLKTNLAPDYFQNPYSFTQDWTETDLTQSAANLGYHPQFDLQRGIDAYHASGRLGV